VAAADGCGSGWVTGWQAASQPADADPRLGGSTLRMIVRPQVTGSEVRVRLSNAYGTGPLAVGAVSAARSDGGAGLLPGTVRPVAFGGRPGVVIPAGADVVSDPVPLVAEAGRPLAVSMFLPVRPAVVTQHAVALQTSYLSRPGDFTLAGDGPGFDTPVRSWLVLTGVDVLAPRAVNAVVTIGDSITDGVGTSADADQRWPDALSGLLTGTGGSTTMAVLNAGISRNRLLADDPAADGDSPLTRFDRDVAAASGATDVVLHIGTNDIAAGRGAGDIVAGLQRFAERARTAVKRVFLTTITPSVTGAHGTPAAVATRDTVNTWVRAHGREHADGVFDFAAVVADPAQPSRLAPPFDSGDGLHLSAAGYRALAGAVDAAALTGSPCLADTTPARVVVSGS
jgi:lysophospholipase L1-like esterase